MDSKTGLVIQFTGIVLIAALSLFLRRSLKTTASSRWLIAWIALVGALLALSTAFNFYQSSVLYGVYFFLEYAFGLFLISGCKSLAGDDDPFRGIVLPVLPLCLLAFILSVGVADLNVIFNIHAIVMAVMFGFAFFVLRNARLKAFGWRVMRVALALLAIDFFHYGIVFTLLLIFPGFLSSDNYLAFEPIIDLVLEILLGFGMVIVLLEEVLDRVQNVNEELRVAHERISLIAHLDPLTEAFNRHAFYSYLESGEKATGGCVAFFDIDDLKPINDQYGHPAGDAVIRQVSRTLRELIRSDDVIYRWGGDEFFVLMIGITPEAARTRLSAVDVKLRNVELEGVGRPITIRVSYGIEAFETLSELEAAVQAADGEMYRRKLERKKRRYRDALRISLSDENIVVGERR